MANKSTLSGGSLDDGGEVVYHCDGTYMYEYETITGAFYILIFIFSITGHGLLLCVLFFYENLKNVTNIFVLNLACSDLIFTFTLPFWATYQLNHWVFGEFACKLMTAAYIVGLYSSLILLTAITVDRFITVVLHNCSVKRQRRAVVACVAAWVISAAASVSEAIKMTVKMGDDGLFLCEDASDATDIKLGYYLQVSLLFFLPLVIIVFCYSAILKTVLQNSNRMRHSTVVVVLCIVAAFIICWGPYNILLFIQSLYEPKNCDVEKRLNIAYYICRILAYSHCCMNPLLYMLSQKLRRHLLDFLCCKKARNKNREKGTGHSTSVIQNAAFTAQNTVVNLELHSNRHSLSG